MARAAAGSGPERAGSGPERPGDAERSRDAERTQREILDVALNEFARNGYSGARVDEIAAKTSTAKRMIYYYFGGKEQLYIAVLERAYATARDAESRIDIDHLDPVAAIRTLAELTFDHHESHPDFIALVATENIHRGEFIAKSRALAELNTPAVEILAKILHRGYADGTFTRRVEAIDVHMMISAFCFFRVANRHTFGAIFGVDLLDTGSRAHYREMVGDLVVSYLTSASRRLSQVQGGHRLGGHDDLECQVVCTGQAILVGVTSTRLFAGWCHTNQHHVPPRRRPAMAHTGHIGQGDEVRGGGGYGWSDRFMLSA